ncbi:MAG: glutathione S-transferase [Parvibaculum sp.]|jgi:glutathione S-transferase|uniref:glutathione S-transferase family protein n=1 Tax=Parvibaculum sp. TaxID=2024848 RepID=UPI000C428797|nr:glutathione S-transferase family protein [Parvibaculum sp.]MAU59251.1 glutathione S-transferase [Parvibaculum sp.]|tara:strand:+ start:6241 stop:7320 length:1080 start_codon:yes stop_codon:yes gene_type:complete
MDGVYRLLGGPGSPYSHKLRAVLRYRHIPHRWIVPLGAFRGSGSLGEGTEIAEAGKRQVPVIQFPDGSYHSDSTPIIDELEKRHPGERSVIPDDPGMAFLARVIEEASDEWLPLPMFDYRWNEAVDRVFCPRRQMAGWLGAVSEAELGEAAASFLSRQETLREFLGGTVENRPLLQSTYEELMGVMESHLATQLFLFGSRPSIADFGLYGQLSQYAVDPTTSNLMKQKAVRLFQWVQLTDDASGIEGEWNAPDVPLSTGARGLLKLAGEVALPMLQAAVDAHLAGKDFQPMVADIRSHGFKTLARPYQAHTLLWLKQAYAALDEATQGRIEPALVESGCLPWLSFREGEREKVPPYCMA